MCTSPLLKFACLNALRRLEFGVHPYQQLRHFAATSKKFASALRPNFGSMTVLHRINPPRSFACERICPLQNTFERRAEKGTNRLFFIRYLNSTHQGCSRIPIPFQSIPQILLCGEGISTNPSLLAIENTIGGAPSSESLYFRREIARFLLLFLFMTLPVTYVSNLLDIG